MWRNFKNDIAFVRVLKYNIFIKLKECMFMGFMCARQAVDKWGISQRRVAVLCSENRIANATMVGNM